MTAGGPTWDAVVVGGGVAGLVAARDLAAAGLRTVVLDADAEPGGAVRGHTVAGLRLDAGAESFATRGGTVAAYLGELGLRDRVCLPASHGSWVHLPSGDGPLPRAGLLGIPSEPFAADVRRTIGLVGALRASLDRVLPARVGAAAPSLGALVRARLGARVLDRLVRPVVAGVHASDPDDLDVGAVSPGLPAALRESRSLTRAVRTLRASAPAGSAVQGIEGGLHVLVDTLVADLRAQGVEVRTGTRARRLRPDPAEAVAYDVELGEGTALRTRRVVLASPAAADLLAEHAPGGSLPSLDAGAVVTLVTLVVDAPALDGAPRGTGVLVAREASDVTAKALTHATAKWPWLARTVPAGRHVVRLSYGRAGDADRVPDDEDALVDLGLRDASVLLGARLDRSVLVGSAVVRWTQALPRPSAAHREAVAQVRATAAALPGVAVCGAWTAGNGLASVIPDARAAASALVG
ncbi:protoporphyrinogen oxidase [Cellulomonas fimi]|uniref:protoporphyrinogen oxidase n=1 Tax=Cellulomonas fimi TaxID=1708 RepID=UPI00234DF59F|nr:protoporphyrinogen oxidase [Cellulomonas fimi]MDC7123483.1 protoporphyrinogen oxidase [Cellulomonas fimi]